MTAPKDATKAIEDPDGRPQTAECIAQIQSGIRDQLVAKPRGLSELALLSFTKSAINATGAPHHKVRQLKGVISADNAHRAASLARDVTFITNNAVQTPAPNIGSPKPRAAYSTLEHMLAGPLASGMAGALIFSQHHNLTQCEKQDYLKHADQHLNLALKQMQAGLGLVDTTINPRKRSKKGAASSAAPPAE